MSKTLTYILLASIFVISIPLIGYLSKPQQQPVKYVENISQIDGDMQSILSHLGLYLPLTAAEAANMNCVKERLPTVENKDLPLQAVCENKTGHPYVGIFWKKIDYQKVTFQKEIINRFLKNRPARELITETGEFSCTESADKKYSNKDSVRSDCVTTIFNSTTTLYTTFIYTYPIESASLHVNPVIVISSGSKSETATVVEYIFTKLNKMTLLPTPKKELVQNTFLIERAYAGGGGGGDGGASCSATDAAAASASSASASCSSAGSSSAGEVGGGVDIYGNPWIGGQTITSCWDGSTVVSSLGEVCPVRPTTTCWDGSVVTPSLGQSCPARPTTTCWDGSVVTPSLGEVCPVPPPVVNLDPFSPSTILTGNTSSFAFSSTNATACSGFGVVNGNLGTSNTSVSTAIINTPGTYTQYVTCTGPSGTGTSVTRALVVDGPASITDSSSSPGADSGFSGFNISPRSVDRGGLVKISWGIHYPNAQCKITAAVQIPATCDATCQSDRAAASSALNSILASGTTNANDPYGASRNMTTALTTKVPSTQYARGEKSVVLDYSTTFTLSCGTGANTFTPARSIIYVTDRTEG